MMYPYYPPYGVYPMPMWPPYPPTQHTPPPCATGHACGCRPSRPSRPSSARKRQTPKPRKRNAPVPKRDNVDDERTDDDVPEDTSSSVASSSVFSEPESEGVNDESDVDSVSHLESDIPAGAGGANYPSPSALRNMMTAHLTLVEQYVQTSFALTREQAAACRRVKYCTLEDTRKYIEENRKPIPTFEEALKMVQDEE
ncbi:hypothetical protein HK104_003811 [Borealophlyctis nickersoniae]|nr:hypothetical protein HK104_003811 [Borealophlyctis nickersoniae]